MQNAVKEGRNTMNIKKQEEEMEDIVPVLVRVGRSHNRIINKS